MLFYIKPKKSFTIVELIIVVAIMAIFSFITIWLFSKWIWRMRDSRRLADINTIKKSLDTWLLDLDNKDKTLPYPTSGIWVWITWVDWSTQLWIQWVFGDSVVEKIPSLTKVPVDPTTNKGYVYSITNSYKKYQVLAIMEERKVYKENIVYAQNLYSMVKWNFVSAIYVYQLTWISVLNYGAYYIPSIIAYSWINKMWDDCSNQYFVIDNKPYTKTVYNKLLGVKKCIKKLWTWNYIKNINDNISDIIDNLSWMIEESVNADVVKRLIKRWETY